MVEHNPYQSTATGLADDAPSPSSRRLQPVQIFACAYFSSLAVAAAVVVIWLIVVFNDASIPPTQRRTRPPDVVELLFLFAATLPSVVTCACFSFLYCLLVKINQKRKLWPAVLFGIFSGLVFNAMNAITVIEYFFDW